MLNAAVHELREVGKSHHVLEVLRVSQHIALEAAFLLPSSQELQKAISQKLIADHSSMKEVLVSSARLFEQKG